MPNVMKMVRAKFVTVAALVLCSLFVSGFELPTESSSHKSTVVGSSWQGGNAAVARAASGVIGLGSGKNGAPVDSDTRPISGTRRRRQAAAAGGGVSGTTEHRPQRATVAPLLQGLSLLDLPVFSRGDRPSSMDKTLGAIFSKVAFSTNQSGSASPAGPAPPVKNTENLFDKADERNASSSSSPSNNGTSSVSASTPLASTTTTSTTSSVTTAINDGGATSPAPSVRSKPVFEFDTRIFDFIPYDRTPPPLDPGRQYNPNVPGLRGPSRINTARNPASGQQPFNLRPTIPPLISDLTSTTTTTVRTTTSATTVASTTTTVATSTAVADSAAATEVEEILPAATTTAAPSTTSTAAPSNGVHQTAANGNSNQDGGISGSNSEVQQTKESSAHENRETAWSIQVYGTSSLFALLGIFTLSNLLRLRTSTRRLLSTSHCLSIQLLVLFLSITRSIHLLYDAYNHRRLLPPALAFSIFNVAFPCLSSALAVLLLGVFKATKLQVMPAILVKPALWAALVAFHFALSLSIDIVVGSVGGLFSLHLASQAYFVLWSLALSLGYLAAFAPATRAANSLQTETMRSQLTALHIHGASLPRQLPQSTLLRAVRVTLATAILALLVAAFQLYGMFGVYGLPWRTQQSSAAGSSSMNSGTGSNSHPIVLTPEFLARYQGLQRERNLNVEALREVLGLPLSMAVEAATSEKQQRDIWPVATENFWPWWTYQLIARLLELIMGTLLAFCAALPLRHSPSFIEKQDASSASSSATKRSSLFADKMPRGRYWNLCVGRNDTTTRTDLTVGAMTDMSPIKSMSPEESPYPPANMRNYCYSNPTTGQHAHQHQERPSMPIPLDSISNSGTLPSFSVVYGSKRSSQLQQHQRPRCASTLSHAQAASALVNDNGFIRFRDGIDRTEQPYEDVDRQHLSAVSSHPDHHHSQHIYQELGHKGARGEPSQLYYCSTSSMTSSSHTNKGTATTPSTCYEHLCRRGLAGYYEPQRYEMQLPNNAQLLSLLAKESCQMFQPCNIYGGSLSGQHPPPPAQHLLLQRQHCQHCHCGGAVQHAPSTSGSGMESSTTSLTHCDQKSPNYESYGLKPEGQSPANQSDVLQGGNLFHQLSMASHRQALIKNQQREAGLVTDLDSPSKFACSDCVIEEDSEVGNNFTDASVVYEMQDARTCSSVSAANSFDIQFHPLVDPVRLSSSDPSLLLDGPPNKNRTKNKRKVLAPSWNDSPDSGIVRDFCNEEKTTSESSPMNHLFRLGSLSFKREGCIASSDSNLLTRSSLPSKFFQRFRTSAGNNGNNNSNNAIATTTTSSSSLHPSIKYDYSPLVASDENIQSLIRPDLQTDTTCLSSSKVEYGDQSSSPSFWLSPDLLRIHTKQLCNANSTEEQDIANTDSQLGCAFVDLCDAVNSDRQSLFPTSLSEDSEALNTQLSGSSVFSSAHQMLSTNIVRPFSINVPANKLAPGEEDESTV